MDAVESGKKMIKAAIIALLLTNVIAIVINAVSGPAGEATPTILKGAVRLVIIGAILYYFYDGDKVAKWLLVIPTLISGVLGFIVALVAFNFLFLAINSIYIAIGIVLMSKPVNNFLIYRREEYQKECNVYEDES